MPSASPPPVAAPTPTRPQRVLVAGAGGFLGRAVVRALADGGYEVRGLVRDAAAGERVRESGGIPYRGDVLDPPSIRAAAGRCDAIVHLAAHPGRGQDENAVRVEGGRNLLSAARAEGARRFLLGSGYWVYRGRPEPIDETSPLEPRGESKVNRGAELVALEAHRPGELEVLVLRPGMVYGNGSWFRALALGVASGEYSVVGDGRNRWSFVALPDAGAAFRAVLSAGSGGEVYNVVDGRPAPLREFVDFVAAQAGVRPPPSISLEDAAGTFGETDARHLAADRPTSNGKLLGLGWTPRFPTYRDGVPGVLRDLLPSSGRRGGPRTTAGASFGG
jgi:nucleoside-diphosphate-sugar epimerase